MAKYLADGVMYRGLDYVLVTEKYSQFKTDIDNILIANGKGNLIIL